MLKFLTSLSFLYAFTILVLLVYGFLYYRSFVRTGYQKKRFPLVFFLVGAACFSFLYFNIHAPLSLKTFSNLDHHFIRQDGFRVAQSIELGRNDTVNYRGLAYNRFLLKKQNNQLLLSAAYSEEPFYISTGDVYSIASSKFPAPNKTISFAVDSVPVGIHALADTAFELNIGQVAVCRTPKPIKKGSSAWGIFKDDINFINSSSYTNEKLVAALKSVLVLRDNVSRTAAGELVYFIPGNLSRLANQINYDGTSISRERLAFSAIVPDKANIAWGIGFLDNNRNQFRVQYAGADSFALWNRYPVSYPLTEEDKNDWSKHTVTKFLVSNGQDMQGMPSVFSEGFLFSPFDGDANIAFTPVLLRYQKDKANAPLQLQAAFMNGSGTGRVSQNGSVSSLILPAKSAGFSWVFSIQNSFDWHFSSTTMHSGRWQLLLFGSLLFFFIVLLAASWVQPVHKLSWIWQLLTSITMVLLTTRFFLYWRYKSFPPYEGMDLPALQQLNSFWNFGIILAVTLLLAAILGFSLFRSLYTYGRVKTARLLHRSYSPAYTSHITIKDRVGNFIINSRVVKAAGEKLAFFGAWLLLLLAGGAFAALNGFDPSVCRHLAIAMVLLYFLFLYISYHYSPLVGSVEKRWWSLSTGRSFDMIINNPVKVLLSVSLLGLFAFADIGFAIIFLNFLLFNEAFLCINYAIAGLSAGSKKNASLFGVLGFFYLFLFVINLVYGPYIFKFLLDLPQLLYLVGYIVFSIGLSYTILRLWPSLRPGKKILTGMAISVVLFAIAFLFFPKEKILEKAAITKYRIDVMTMPIDQAIETAYQDGKTYEPVIRAAQNQWFINTFIYEKNNPAVSGTGFHLLPHAPQNKGARYNAQATDLVASRFFIAEHGRWSVLLYVLLLLVPTTLLASFYKLYPDFTNRINNNYPTITAGFSLLNYLLITALLVILAATGRYIFFGQDMPFGSILSKQSILFPSILIVTVIMLFRHIPLEQYPNRRKLIPGAILFAGLALLLLLVKPVFNKEKEFGISDLAKNMDSYIDMRLQPVLDYIDTAKATRRLPMMKKDKLFTDSVRQLLAAGAMGDAGKFFTRELETYTRAGFSRHLDQSKMLYLDLNAGRPQLAVNDNYFRIEPPPHLQQFWAGNVYSDTSNYNITVWNTSDATVVTQRVSSFTDRQPGQLTDGIRLAFAKQYADNLYGQLCIINTAVNAIQIKTGDNTITLAKGDSFHLHNPDRLYIKANGIPDQLLVAEPDAFMRNYYVNGSRFYSYPMGSDFIWARNFAESVSSEYTASGQTKRNAFISLDAVMMDSLSERIKTMLTDTAYKKGAEYGIAIADGNGRLLAMPDFIKGLERPDPNDKAGFNRVVRGENGYVSQSLLRKQIGNINLLRMNPGPGSTLKPIVFSAIASRLNLDWDAFAAEGFSQKQNYFGGEKVAEYDFEKNNGRIASVVDYLRYSDNYYHSNLLLLGSYDKQGLQELLLKHFATRNPEAGFHWPYFNYKGKQYWLDGFSNWPGYTNGKANFGSDSSFVSQGLLNNYGIYTYRAGQGSDRFSSSYDSMLFRQAWKKSGFILPEYALFDQKGTGMDNRKPNEVFMSSFRGHVKGSSQVMVPPVKMVDAFGKMVSQNKNYKLTLNPYAAEPAFTAFDVDNGVSYAHYLSIMKEDVFEGLRQVLFNGGTAARLGGMLKNGEPYYYYAKTGTTGDDELKSKSKLFAIVISQKDITSPGFNFRKNKFYTIYFTSQNGPAKQNEEFQAAVIKYVQQTPAFIKYMRE